MSYKIDLLPILDVSKRKEEEQKEIEKKEKEEKNYKKLVQTHLKKGKKWRWDPDTEEYIYSYPKSPPMTIDNVIKKKITFKTLDI